MNKYTKVLDRLFEQYKIKMDFDDYYSQLDYEWFYYVNSDYSITVDAIFNYNEPNEYETTVSLNANDEIKKSFKEGEEMELITFITNDKLKLAKKSEIGTN